MTPGYDFRIDNESALAAALPELLGGGTPIPHSTHTGSLDLLDSFDWRLYHAGLGLRVERLGGVSTLLCRDVTNPERTLTVNIDRSPHFWTELPDGLLRRRLARPLDIRAMIPRLTVNLRRSLYPLLDGEQKTVARLYWERLSQRRARKTLSLLRIEPLRGYRKSADALAQRLKALPAVTPLECPWEVEAYRWAGLQPGDYESRLNVALQPQMRSDAALRTLLEDLTRALELNAPGLREAIDTEFLHDYRVAVRRIRSALSQLKELLPQRTRERFRREFAWLGEITGPARDLDVYLLNFDHYLSLLPAPLAADLEPLRAFLCDRQQQAYRELVAHLDSARYRRLLSAWHRYLATPLPAHSRLPGAMQPIIAVADRRIWRAYRKVVKDGRKIHDDSAPQQLHQLRIRCKRLRYLLEFFRSLYPKRRIGAAIEGLKELQDVLGRFQDLEVQQHALHHFGEQMSLDDPAHNPTHRALSALIAKLQMQQHETRGHFAARFQRFAAAKQHKEFAALFHTATASDP